MSGKKFTYKLSGTSPAAAGQAKLTLAAGQIGEAGGLEEYDQFFITALLVGATGGTLDVYLQRKVLDDGSVWADWAHFPQLAAGAAAIKYAVVGLPPPASTTTVIGTTADDGTTGAPALAANTVVGGHPGGNIRVLCVAGAGTSAGAAVTVYVSAKRTNW